MDRKVGAMLAISSLIGVLIGAGISFGTALQELRHVREDIGEIKGELRERNNLLSSRVGGIDTRLQALEIEVVRLQVPK